jgi:hypothetical protein
MKEKNGGENMVNDNYKFPFNYEIVRLGLLSDSRAKHCENYSHIFFSFPSKELEE